MFSKGCNSCDVRNTTGWFLNIRSRDMTNCQFFKFLSSLFVLLSESELMKLNCVNSFYPTINLHKRMLLFFIALKTLQVYQYNAKYNAIQHNHLLTISYYVDTYNCQQNIKWVKQWNYDIHIYKIRSYCSIKDG